MVTFMPTRFLAALDRHMTEETRFDSRSVALRHAFEDWCIHMGYVSPNEMDPDLNQARAASKPGQGGNDGRLAQEAVWFQLL